MSRMKNRFELTVVLIEITDLVLWKKELNQKGQNKGLEIIN